MKNALGRCPALVGTLLLAGGCDGDGPALTGSCRFECLNQIRHLFEQCTSPWGTACQGQDVPPNSVTNFCFDDGNKRRWSHFLASGVIDTTVDEFYSGGALCVKQETRLLQGGFSSETYVYAANGDMLARVDGTGVDAPDPSGHLDCETDYAYLDPEDASCIPYGMPGSPAWVPDNTLACVTSGTCAIP